MQKQNKQEQWEKNFMEVAEAIDLKYRLEIRDFIKALLSQSRQEAVEDFYELVNEKVIGENEEKPINNKADEPLEVAFRNLHRTQLRIRLTKQKNNILKSLSSNNLKDK